MDTGQLLCDARMRVLPPAPPAAGAPVRAPQVCYLTLTEKAYPKKLAFQYLEELQSEFSRLYGGQIDGVTRPYAFIKFGEQRLGKAGQAGKRGSRCGQLGAHLLWITPCKEGHGGAAMLTFALAGQHRGRPSCEPSTALVLRAAQA